MNCFPQNWKARKLGGCKRGGGHQNASPPLVLKPANCTKISRNKFAPKSNFFMTQRPSFKGQNGSPTAAELQNIVENFCRLEVTGKWLQMSIAHIHFRSKARARRWSGQRSFAKVKKALGRKRYKKLGVLKKTQKWMYKKIV